MKTLLLGMVIGLFVGLAVAKPILDYKKRVEEIPQTGMSIRKQLELERVARKNYEEAYFSIKEMRP